MDTSHSTRRSTVLDVAAGRTPLRPSSRRGDRRAPHRRRPRGRVPDILVVALFALALAGTGALPTLADDAPRTSATRRVSVEASDTLWDIAAANALPGTSVAETVDEIRRLNGLRSDQVLQPGAVVVVPAQEAPHTTFVQR